MMSEIMRDWLIWVLRRFQQCLVILRRSPTQLFSGILTPVLHNILSKQLAAFPQRPLHGRRRMTFVKRRK